MRVLRNRYRNIVSESKLSPTVTAILAYVYRKEEFFSLVGKYGKSVVRDLVTANFLKEVVSQKGIFYFRTEKSENFKAVDFAAEYLWAFHNTSERIIKEGKKYILCFDESLPGGRDMVEIEEAIQKALI